MTNKNKYDIFSLRELVRMQDDLEKYVELKAKADLYDKIGAYFFVLALISLLSCGLYSPMIWVAGVSGSISVVFLWLQAYTDRSAREYGYGFPAFFDADDYRALLEEAVNRKFQPRQKIQTTTNKDNIISVDFSAKRLS